LSLQTIHDVRDVFHELVQTKAFSHGGICVIYIDVGNNWARIVRAHSALMLSDIAKFM
jgi:hypothetical protein